MAKDKEKEVVQPEVSAEQLQNDTDAFKARITELEAENNVLKDEVTSLKDKIKGLSEVTSDNETLRTENKDGEVKVKFLISPAGKFLLPYNVGQVVELPANQADEIVDCKYAEYVK